MIKENAFSDCYELREVVFPESLNIIDNAAFKNCRNFRTITLPANVSYIGESAFEGISIDEVHSLNSTPPTCEPYCFFNINRNSKLYVPGGSIEAYSQANEWNNFFNIFAEEDASINESSVTYDKGFITPFASGKGILIENTSSGIPIEIFSTCGVPVYNGYTEERRTEIALPAGQTYIVKYAGHVQKVVL